METKPYELVDAFFGKNSGGSQSLSLSLHWETIRAAYLETFKTTTRRRFALN